jgi:hypothetical protein
VRPKVAQYVLDGDDRRNDTVNITKSAILTAILPLTGCFLFNNPVDPCAEGSPLQQDPKVAADCQECGQSPCPPGETGGDEPTDWVTCPANDKRYCYNGTNINSANTALAVPGGLVEIPASECTSSQLDELGTLDYWCAIGWDGKPVADWIETDCIACEKQGGINHVPIDPPGGEPACRKSDSEPASGVGPWGVVFDNEPAIPMCSPSMAPPFDHYDWSCPKGLAQVWEADDPWTHAPSNNWTCRCESDADCQPGAVCNAWWVKDIDSIFGHGHFTMCVWPDGGDANGAAPEGPSVYGLSAWEDGITVTSTRQPHVLSVRITPSFLLALSPGLWNDDQRVDEATGEITHCGDESLCDHMGLAAGDVMDADPLVTEGQLYYGTVELVAYHPTGDYTVFLVSMDLDGDLAD